MMTLEDYSAFFQPDELKALAVAYDAAWKDLGEQPMSADQAMDLRRRLAQVILASACTGERDVRRLTAAALRAVATELRPRARR
jgi:hypothetical protein